MPIFSCRDWLINFEERRVIKNGVFLDLTPKSFDVIQLLIERHGTVVTKDDILGIVWNGSFVEEGNLPVHISKIRHALGQTKDEPFIETVPGVGYRFIGPLKKVSENEWLREIEKTSSRRKLLRNTIAVLPFSTAMGDPEHEYLAEGIYFQLTNTLARLSDLRVLARETVIRIAKAVNPSEEASRQLGVAYMVQVRMRIFRAQIFLNCEIIDCSSGSLVWGQSFIGQEPQLVTVESELVSAVVTEILNRINLSSERNFGLHTSNYDSYRVYLKGKHFHEKATKADLEKAIVLLNESIRYDPTNLASYVELAETYLTMFCCDYKEHKATYESIDSILRITSDFKGHDDTYYSLLGGKSLYLDWDFEKALEHFRRAISINPGCLLARYRLASALLSMRRFSEALREMREISTIDPISVQSLIRSGRTFFKMRRFDSAASYLEEALELAPDNYIVLDLLAATYSEIGRLDEALSLLKRSIEINHNLDTLSFLGCVYALKNEPDEAQKAIDEIRRQGDCESSSALKIARILLPLGRIDEAFECLERAIEARDVDLISIDLSGNWLRYQNDPRYVSALKRINLPYDSNNVDT